MSGISGEAGRSGMVAGGGEAEPDLEMPGEVGLVAIFGAVEQCSAVYLCSEECPGQYNKAGVGTSRLAGLFIAYSRIGCMT